MPRSAMMYISTLQLRKSQSCPGDMENQRERNRALEVHMAKITGKEAAIFMPSGTASNQIALRTHLKQPPFSVLVDKRAHINKYVATPLEYPKLLLTCVGMKLAAPRSILEQPSYLSCPLTVSIYCQNSPCMRYILSAHHLTLDDIKNDIITTDDVHL